ncbi:hypothetical protein BGZ97_012572 [Linnemannia gamsii]|jgi:hypothetical protein|uniref:Uncharacterized protein n=1 Tax=Linnemannia gamsii TaxID=64522 RepID=A0A9P6RMA3_9FUNG|nr:hypothetical protein BGZ97_012572 [Linnemannia gamsii]
MAVVCEFTYIRRQSPGNIVQRYASCYWADRDAAQCSSATDSLYKTLGRTCGPSSVRCKYTDDVYLFGWAYFEFDKFNSACKRLGGSNAFPEINADSDAKCENPNNNPDEFSRRDVWMMRTRPLFQKPLTTQFTLGLVGDNDQ